MKKLILFILLICGIGVQAQFNITVDTVFLDVNGDTLYTLKYDGTNLIINEDTIDLSGSLADMTKAVYDPQTIEGDAFARANMTGTQAQSTVVGLVDSIAAHLARLDNLDDTTTVHLDTLQALRIDVNSNSGLTLDDVTTNGNTTTNDITVGNIISDSISTGALYYSDSYWDDLQINISSAKLHPSNTPTWITYRGGYVLSFDEGDEDEIYFTAQLPHKYKHGSDIEFHLHVVFPNGNSGDVDWVFTYSWANIGDDFPTETSVNVQAASSEDADKHVLTEIAATITGTGKEGSSFIICSLTRDGNDAVNDTYGSDVYLVGADFHHEIDKPGSDEETP